ncbi:MAG: gamma-glutamylcyclotransferase [Proteobacteria bacterium]|nr:gamma-glutamylcyclotransferase [Pseudomonadota bacterium]
MLENDSVRRAVEQSGHSAIMLSEEQLLDSLNRTLKEQPKNQPIWVFGYGSLIWNPMLEYVDKRPALIHGYHRGFYCWSRINRGSPENPGLVLALDYGGSCRGIAYQLQAEKKGINLLILWRREMLGNVYIPKWVRAETAQGVIHAVTFVIDRSSSAYAGKLDEDRVVSIAMKASGHYGSCSDYLIDTAESLKQENIRDNKIFRLASKLLSRRGHLSNTNDYPTNDNQR